MTTGFFLDDFYQEIDNPEGKGTVIGNAGYFGKKIGKDSKGNPIYNNLGQKYANDEGRLFGFSAAFKLGTKAGTDNWTALIKIKDKFANLSDKEKATLILDTVLEYKSTILNNVNRGKDTTKWFYAQNFQKEDNLSYSSDSSQLYSQVAAILWAAKTLYPDTPVFPVFDSYLMKSGGTFTIDKISKNLKEIGLDGIIKKIDKPLPQDVSNWNIVSTLYHSDLIDGFIGDSFKSEFEGKLPIAKNYPTDDPNTYALPFFHETTSARPPLPYAVDSKYEIITKDDQKVDFEYFGNLYNLGDNHTAGDIPLDSSLYVAGDISIAKGYDANNNISATKQPIGFGLNNEIGSNGDNSTVTTKDGDFVTGEIENNGTMNLNETIHNYGSIINNGLLNAQGVINSFFGNISNNGTIAGAAEIRGDFSNSGLISPGNSAGGLLFNGSLTHAKNASKVIELGGDCNSFRDRINTEFDFIDVTGDLILDGGMLEVELIDGFELSEDQAFVIARVGGDLQGEYSGLENGALVGEFNAKYGGMTDLFISYDYTENEITLFTK